MSSKHWFNWSAVVSFGSTAHNSTEVPPGETAMLPYLPASHRFKTWNTLAFSWLSNENNNTLGQTLLLPNAGWAWVSCNPCKILLCGMEVAGTNEAPTAVTVSGLKDQPEGFQQQVAALPYYLLYARSNMLILLSKGSKSSPLHATLKRCWTTCFMCWPQKSHFTDGLSV